MTTPKSKNDFERKHVPTIAELRAGSPASLAALTNEARNLQAFANMSKGVAFSIGTDTFRIGDDHTLNDAQKLTRSAKLAKTKIDRARADFANRAEAAIQAANNLRRQLDEAVKPPTSQGQALIDNELRAYVRGLNDAERLTAIRNDPALRAAVARAPAVLTGLTPEAHDAVKHEFLESVLPDAKAQYDDLVAALETGNSALGMIEDDAKSLIDFDTAAAYEKASTATLA